MLVDCYMTSVFLYTSLHIMAIGISLDQPVRIFLVVDHLRNDQTQQPWQALGDDGRVFHHETSMCFPENSKGVLGNLNIIPQDVRRNIFKNTFCFFLGGFYLLIFRQGPTQPMANIETLDFMIRNGWVRGWDSEMSNHHGNLCRG